MCRPRVRATPWPTRFNYGQIIRQVLTDGTPRSLGESTRLVANFHTITTDAYIADYQTKYHYQRWRPVTAIRMADVDGNADTAPDPTWLPLFAAPDNPEYVSGHNAYTGAATTALAALVGPKPNRPITRTADTAPGFTRTYTAWDQLVQDVMDARVWAGIHFRTSDERGVKLGQQVARYDLRQLRK